MDFEPIFLIVNFVSFFLALSAHEFSHALAAYYQGDRTAEYAGRLTLNPLAHIDIFGTVILPLFLILSNAGIVFGWAKPVPVNYFNLKDQKWGPALVSLAGPLANLIFGIICIIIWNINKYYLLLPANNLFVRFIFMLILVNVVLMIFNLIPIYPLDGSKIFLAIIPDRYENFKIFWEKNGLLFLIILLLFGTTFLDYIFYFIFTLISPFV